MAPFFLHETNSYGAWNAEAGLSAYSIFNGSDELRQSGQYRVLTPAQFVVEQKASQFPFTIFHPLCGGMPIELAWSSLRLFEQEVLPAFP